MASWVTDYFGGELLTKDGLRPSVEVLANYKYVGIYFSAHWCPPCRGFTPVLSEFYEGVKSDMIIVFVSSDRDPSSFSQYYGEMPWVALPFENRDKKTALASKYGVNGIPTFIVLNSNGETKDSDGRSTVVSHKGNPTGAFSVWA